MTANRPVLGTRPMTSQQLPSSVGHNHSCHCYLHPPLILYAAQPCVRAPTAPEGRQHAYFQRYTKASAVPRWPHGKQTCTGLSLISPPTMALICMHIQFCLFKSKGSGVALNLWADKFLSNGESLLDISPGAQAVSWLGLHLFGGHRNSVKDHSWPWAAGSERWKAGGGQGQHAHGESLPHIRKALQRAKMSTQVLVRRWKNRCWDLKIWKTKQNKNIVLTR